MKEINVMMQGDQKVLTYREGQALEIKPPNVIKITGDINTVKNYFDKRYLTVDPLSKDEREKLKEPNYSLQHFYKETGIVTFDAAKLSIELQVNPQDFYGPVVFGQMQVSDELKPFSINTDKTFSREQLIKLIRFNKRHFTDAAIHDSLLKAYQTLNLTGNTTLKAESDNRGNRNDQFKKAIDSSNIPTDFYLTMPIYQGLPAEKFQVEVCLDSSDSTVIFWFESVELKEKMDIIRDKIFNEQKELFKELVIVNK